MSKSPDDWGIKDLLGGLLGGAILAILGLWMLLLPGARDHEPAKDSARLLGKLLDLIWSIPGGLALILIGMAIFGLTTYQMVTQYNRPRR